MLRVAIFCWTSSCHSYKCNIKQENPTGGISLHILRCWRGELQACVWLFIESTFSFTAPKDTLWIHNMTMRFREFFEQRTKSNLLFTRRASKKIDFLLHPACFAKTILHCRRIWEDEKPAVGSSFFSSFSFFERMRSLKALPFFFFLLLFLTGREACRLFLQLQRFCILFPFTFFPPQINLV